MIAVSSTLDQVRAAVAAAGGSVLAALDDYVETDRLSGMSYNHPVYFLQRGQPDKTWFHMETAGEVILDDPDAVRAVYEGPVHLHLELFARGPGAMVVARLPVGAGDARGDRPDGGDRHGRALAAPVVRRPQRRARDRDRAAHRPEGAAQPGQAHRGSRRSTRG